MTVTSDIDLVTRRAWLRVELAADADKSVDLALVVEALDGLVTCPVRIAFFNTVGADERTATIQSSLMDQRTRYGRQVPDLLHAIAPTVRFGEYHDPLTAPALTLAANAWFRRVLHQYDRKAYDDIFGFASIQRAEKHSPIVLELGIVVAASVLIAPTLAYCLLRAVHRHRENDVKQEIWEAQRDAYREFARQQRAKAIILEELAAEPIRDAHGLRLGDSVLEALANVAAPSVADLSGSPIIEKVTLGVNVDTK